MPQMDFNIIFSIFVFLFLFFLFIYVFTLNYTLPLFMKTRLTQEISLNTTLMLKKLAITLNKNMSDIIFNSLTNINLK